MTASRRALAALVALALALAAWLVVEGRAPAVDGVRALVPGLDVGSVTELRWSGDASPGALRRGAAGWRLDDHAVDLSAVDAVLSALRAARWQRRGGAGPAHPSLVLTVAGHAIAGARPPLDDDAPVWIAVDDAAVLVDAWVARALFPTRLALAIRAPLAGAAGRVSLRGPAGEVTVDLDHGARVAPAPLALAPEETAALGAALAGLVIERVAPAPPQAAETLVVDLGDRRAALVAGDVCPVILRAPTGDGCVAPEAAAALVAVAARLAGPAGAIADPRPVAGPVVRVAWPDGAQLELTPRPALRLPGVAPVDLDPDRLPTLRAALATAGERVARPATAAPRALVLTTTAGAPTTLALYPEGLVARDAEPVAVRIAPAAFAALSAPAAELRDPALWLDEATGISDLVIDGVVAARGDVLGEWRGASPARAVALDALAVALAAPRADAAAVPRAAPDRVRRVTVHSRAGARAVTIEMRGERCAVRLSERLAWLAPAACAALR